MSTLKSREWMRNGRPTEIEGNIRELVRQQGSAIRQSDPASEQATNELSNLLRQVSLQSTREVDRLIDDLRRLREKLEEQGNRVQRDIVEYASLSQSVVQLTRIVSEGMTHVKSVPDAPAITSDVLEPASAAADETGIAG
jgi:acetyl esterase/lipase